MRLLILLFMFLFPALAEAQTLAPLHAGRPAFKQSGPETMPLMYVDEASIPLARFLTYTLPMKYWNEMKTCAAKLGYTGDAGAPPTVVVIPGARTIKVRDMIRDSIAYAEDPDFVGEKWSNPTVGYALMRSGLVLTTEPYRLNKYHLRHEALHFIVWRTKHEYGHPDVAFSNCDEFYE